jgi:very-short-patch-repair endonuclease
MHHDAKFDTRSEKMVVADAQIPPDSWATSISLETSRRMLLDLMQQVVMQKRMLAQQSGCSTTRTSCELSALLHQIPNLKKTGSSMAVTDERNMVDAPRVPNSFVLTSLENMRKKLLDLTSRNRLLSFPINAKASSLRIVDELPDQLFAALMSEQTMQFAPVPEPTHDELRAFSYLGLGADKKEVKLKPYPTAKEWAGVLGIKTDFELPTEDDTQRQSDANTELLQETWDLLIQYSQEQGARLTGLRSLYAKHGVDLAALMAACRMAGYQGLDEFERDAMAGKSLQLATTNPAHEDNQIQVMMYPGELEAQLRSLHNKAQTAIEESGAGILYLALGFLEWFESDDSNKARMAPLFTIPVRLERGKLDPMDGLYKYHVVYTGEDILPNLSLREKLHTDFGIGLPEFEDDQTPEEYLARVGEVIRRVKPKWALRRYGSLSLLNFSKMMMYLDLDPSRWPEGERNIAAHHVLTRFFTNQSSDDGPNSETGGGEYRIDDYPNIHSLVPLIDDADSSQHSALIDAIQGKDLVIEGPPGTGKSQTITNLIAAALLNGKKVLFVAEKMAALDVVRHRLNKAGLGDFCLELHSHKSHKRKVLDDIQARLSHDAKMPAEQDIEAQIARYEELKDRLNQYVTLINQPWGATGQTLHEILCGATRYRKKLEIDATRLHIDGLSGMKLDKVSQLRLADQVKAFSQIYHEIRKQIGADCEIYAHPWSGVNNTGIQLFDSQRIVDSLLSWQMALQEFQDVLRVTLDEWRVDAEALRTLPQIESLMQDLGQLPSLAGAELFSALPELVSDDAIQRGREYVTLFEAVQTCYRELASALRPEKQAELEQTPSLALPCDELEQTGVAPESSLNDLIRLLAVLDRARDTLTSVVSQLADLKAALPASIAGLMGDNANGLTFTIRLLSLVSALPSELIRLRDEVFDDDEIDAVLLDMQTQLEALCPLRDNLKAVFQLDHLPEPALLSQTIGLACTGSLFSWFSRPWREARRVLKGLSTQPNAKFSELKRWAPNLLKYAELHQQFSQCEFDKRLASAYRGLDTDVEQLLLLRAWYRQVRETYGVGFGPTVAVGSALLTLDASIIKGIHQLEKQALSKTIESQMMIIQAQLERVPGLAALNKQNQVWLGSDGLLQSISQCLTMVLTKLQAWFQQDDISLLQMLEFGQTIGRVHELRTTLDKTDESVAMFRPRAPLVVGLHSDNRHALSVIDQTLSFASCLNREFSSETLSGLIRNLPDATAYSATCAKGTQLQSLWEQQSCNYVEFSKQTLLDKTLWLKSTDLSLSSILTRNQQAIDQPRWLNGWVNFVRNHEQMREQGLQRIWEAVLSGFLPIDKVEDGLRLAIYDQLSREIIGAHPELARVSGNEHNSRQSLFRDYDKMLIQLQRKRIAAQIASRHVPKGYAGGRKSEYTELALINHELGKKTRHIPIRQLVNRAGHSLLALKPCFMMGPMSAAHYLEPGKMEFDLVVMDEASQVKPEDALGVIARGKQLVVVGDPKQLPPTSFFDRAADDEEDEDVAAVSQTDSILDAALPLFPMRRLRWHYRSQHEKLIAYSNRHFYNNDLVIFPSPHADSPDYGTKFTYVPQGRFSNQHNIDEARVVAEAVVRHAMVRPNESLGVVAMSSKQRDQIERALDELCRERPDAEAAIDKLLAMPDPLFIKNLENVQGDERDVIFISFTYGPAELGGKVYQRFGPINSDVGWRRLNVLFTRSKKRMHVFSSMRSDDVLTSEASKRGVVALKGFLHFAEKGFLDAHTVHSGRGPDSDFEVAVMEALREAGFECEPQVGVAGFFIDLAVIDPGCPGRYLMGIECDGAAYHSAKSARDRDRLRQEVLERLGWNIRRVWSTDWFSNPAEVLAPIIRDLNEMRTPISAVRQTSSKEQPIANVTSSDMAQIVSGAVKNLDLKGQLRHFAQNVIINAFPDVDEDRRLLRPAMLEALLEHQPLSRSEFVERIPKYLREATDPHEAQSFLDQVLSLIDGVEMEDKVLTSEPELA